jgi:methylase of polypeptide subunit release factors
LPALDGVAEKLRAGALVADIGCGHGASTILMAQAYAQSAFVGSDYHDASVETARRAAERAGVADRVTFEIASATESTGGPYNLVCASTPCTTWATPSAWPATCARGSHPMAHG